MKKANMELPNDLKSALRALMLNQLSSDTLDIYELELFDWYARETEAVANQILLDESAYIQEQIRTGNPDINDSGMVAVEYYAKRLRYSHIIYLTSLFETCLERACSKLTTVMGEENLPFGLADLSGDQWSKKRKFLERYGKFEIPKDLWARVHLLITVRNLLVHENGRTSNIKADERKKLEKLPGLRIDGYELNIEEEFIKHSYELIKSFTLSLEEHIKKAIQKAKENLKREKNPNL